VFDSLPSFCGAGFANLLNPYGIANPCRSPSPVPAPSPRRSRRHLGLALFVPKLQPSEDSLRLQICLSQLSGHGVVPFLFHATSLRSVLFHAKRTPQPFILSAAACRLIGFSAWPSYSTSCSVVPRGCTSRIAQRANRSPAGMLTILACWDVCPGPTSPGSARQRPG